MRNVVLLVFYSSPGSDARMRQLSDHVKQVEASGAQIIALPIDGKSAATTGAPYTVVAEGGDETVKAYGLLRRTLVNLDGEDRVPLPAHMEMLVDRYGYVRARWLPRENDAWNDLSRLGLIVQSLTAEPEIRPPPDDHVH